MLKVIPYRTHPQLLHIRSYARAAECAHKALEALILKCRPPFFARDNDGLTLLLKPFYKKAVERIAVCYRRQVGICVDRVDDKAVFSEHDTHGEIFDLAYIAGDAGDGFYYLVPAADLPAVKLACGRNCAAADIIPVEVRAVIVKQPCLFELFVCGVYPQKARLAAYLIRLGYNVAVFEGRDKLIQAVFVVILALARIFLKILGQIVGIVAQKICRIVLIAENTHARSACRILFKLIAILARALYDIRAAVRRGSVGTDDKLAALIEQADKIIVVLAVLSFHCVDRQENLLFLALDYVEIQLRQVLAMVDKHSVFRHKIADPFGEAVVKRLEIHVVNIAYVLTRRIFQIIFFNAAGHIAEAVRPLFVRRRHAVIFFKISAHLFIIQIGQAP